MQHKTLASAVEAIMSNECSIKNDDVGCLRRACKFVWPKKHEPLGGGLFYYKLFRVWDFNDYNPRPHFITATEFCRLMDEDKAEPIDLGRVFDENSDFGIRDGLGKVTNVMDKVKSNTLLLLWGQRGRFYL